MIFIERIQTSELNQLAIVRIVTSVIFISIGVGAFSDILFRC